MQPGELIPLGRHKLLCGDSTLESTLQKVLQGVDKKSVVVFTDPPYGINWQHNPGGNSKKFKKYGGDDSVEVARKFFFAAQNVGLERFLIFGGNYFTAFLPPSGGWLVWDKMRDDLDFSAAELAWSNLINGCRIVRCINDGGRVRNELELFDRIHPNQKPVKMLLDAIEKMKIPPEAVILDAFGGSGSVLMACEVSGRTCLTIERDPFYAGQIADRYTSFLAGAKNCISGAYAATLPRQPLLFPELSAR